MQNPIMKNHRNGYSEKIIRTGDNEIELRTPRDRDTSFDPQIVKKNQSILTDDIDNKIISMYGLGLSYNDIKSNLSELYGIDVSKSLLTSITDKIIPSITEWQCRTLDPVYPIVYLDAIFFSVKEDNKVSKKAVYVVLAINKHGIKGYSWALFLPDRKL